ncbi:MAG: DUF3365 domain-containing protein [Burkholderiales bacterium]
MNKLFCAVCAIALQGWGVAHADDYISEHRRVAGELVQQLGAALKQELGQSGPEGAVEVCKDVAPAIAGELSRSTGWKVSRVSLRPRNPMLGQPDAWEQRVLAQFDRRAAAGVKPDALEYSEIVSEPGGRYARYMKALPVQPLCLACHGTAETVSEGVRARLAAEYPHDRAVGYAAGEIRGAVSIKTPLQPRH